jgi:HSP20 family protein
MVLTRWNPWKELASLHTDLDRLFDQFFGRMEGSEFMSRAMLGSGTWQPALEGYIKDNNLVVRAIVPGVDPKDVNISIYGNTLVIKGERKAAEGIETEDYYFCEIPYGSFERTITLPVEVDVDKIHATYKDGLLEISLPTKNFVGRKKIEIQTEPAAQVKELKAA